MANDGQPAAPFKRELVGHVWVDTGRLVISDPSYLDQLAEREPELLRDVAERCEIVDEGLAIAFHTGPRTGRYPVYVTRFENGCVAKIEIELDARASAEAEEAGGAE